jgi:hypothetical protein
MVGLRTLDPPIGVQIPASQPNIPTAAALGGRRYLQLRASNDPSSFLLGGRPMVGLWTLDPAIGVQIPAPQPFFPRIY